MSLPGGRSKWSDRSFRGLKGLKGLRVEGFFPVHQLQPDGPRGSVESLDREEQIGNCDGELAAGFRLLFLGQAGIMQKAPG